MTVKLGIYDFFVYVIPGGILTSAFLFLFIMHSGLTFDFVPLSIVQFLIFATLSYLIGYANDYLARKLWYRLFVRKSLVLSAIEDLNRDNSMFQVLSEQSDWYICLSFIKRQNPDMGEEIDKLNVQNLMLRNASFGIFIFAIIFVVEIFLGNRFDLYAIGALLCLATSLIFVRESIKFSRWFVHAIYESLVALTITPDQLPIKLLPKAKGLARKKKG